MDSLGRQVTELMREVGRDEVMSRFRNLASHEVEEKSAGELVTVADRESELRLNAGLSRILPDAGIVGEEACAADPAVMDRLTTGLNWLIDPIDGTGNFAAGKPPFAVMVALVDSGIIEAGWMLDPLSGRLCHAARARGASVNGDKVAARTTGVMPPIAGLSLHFLDADARADRVARIAGRFQMGEVPRCAGEQYPRVVLGVHDLAVFERTLPWDHAAGALFVNEAGGRAARPDGSPYVIGSDPGRGLLAAATPALWDEAAAVLYG